MWRDKTYSQRLSDLLKVFGGPVQLYRENNFVRQGLAFTYLEIISVFWDCISCSVSLRASAAVHDKPISFLERRIEMLGGILPFFSCPSFLCSPLPPLLPTGSSLGKDDCNTDFGEKSHRLKDRTDKCSP